MQRLVDADDAATLLAVSPRRFAELRHWAGFPGAISLGLRCLRWSSSELLEWAHAQPRRTPEPEPERLARANLSGRRGG